ncbi:hypothetical protein ACFP3T_01105 [Lactiplantibacillus dongliensis]|uniref:Integral membrane protein n=1 Tax=Lactiplantibacillus dongliensis TaxID=2559919 RepID=A0ABW1R3R1_9LACO|nr:hypothetical protein [Lactiplantibacillus dongliensis]
MPISQYIVIFCLIVVISLIVYLQYALGVMKASVRTAALLPISYASFMLMMTGIVAGFNANSLLFIVSQWLVAYWLYWLYEWGTKHPQQVSPTHTAPLTLKLKKQK